MSSRPLSHLESSHLQHDTEIKDKLLENLCSMLPLLIIVTDNNGYINCNTGKTLLQPPDQQLNPLTLKSDWDLISPYNITPKSNV